MWIQVLVGLGLLVATTIVHGLCTAALVVGLSGDRLARWDQRAVFLRILLVSSGVLLLFLASVLEASLWALVYVAVAAVPSFETALYFSMVTLTTLGYGDVVVTDHWRLLAAFEAATGIIVFGWTTALIVSLVQRVARSSAAPQAER